MLKWVLRLSAYYSSSEERCDGRPHHVPRHPPASWVAKCDCVWFPAERGATKFACFASLELLMERFGARGPSPAEALRAYEIHRPRLQAIVRSQILAGNVSPENEVHLTRETFGLKRVTFSQGVRESPYYFRLARQVTAELEEVAGPSAGNTSAEWDRVEDMEGRVLYLLVVRDPIARASITFTPDQLERSRDVGSHLYRLWDHLLQDRNRKQLPELLGTGQPQD
jgi:hypothetical protein